MELSSLEKFGKLIVLMPAGKGGMGEIDLAYDTERAMLVALKRARVADKQLKKRFIDEQRVAMRLRHSNLLHVYETGEVDGILYLTSEWILGKSLWDIQEIFERRFVQIPPEIACALVRPICAALAHAHNLKGLAFVHRDVSTANIMVGFDGRVHLIDYGLVWSSLKEAKTVTHAFVGNPLFSAPEQWEHQPIDVRTDIYCLGSVLWHLLTGNLPRYPFHGEGKKSLIEPIKKVPGVDSELNELVLRATAEAPEMRFPTAEVLGQALDNWQSKREPVTDQSIASWLENLFPNQRQTKEQEISKLLKAADEQISALAVELRKSKPKVGKNLAMGSMLLLLLGITAGVSFFLGRGSQSNSLIRSPAQQNSILAADMQAIHHKDGGEPLATEQVTAKPPTHIKSKSSELLRQSTIAYEKGLYLEAKDLAAKAAQSGGATQALLIKAEAELKLGQYTEAARDFEKTLKLDTHNRQAQQGLAYIKKIH